MTWLSDWANLLLRWTHLVAGIAWIGSSFYFIWLDRALTPPAAPRPGVEGDLWMVHSGGFYQVEKRRPGPGEIPPVLHWFKYEALFTWITGIALLVLVYYMTGAYLLDPVNAGISRAAALAIGIGVLVVGWFVYDLLWASPLAHRGGGGVATAISLVLLVAVSYLTCRLLSGRAAFMHVGSLLGTIMVANVWLRILPAQQEMLDATRAGRPADFRLGERAKVRSVHNSYMTFPLLFIMLSHHFPGTYANPQNWLVLLLLFVAGAAVRHAMIGRGQRAPWALAPAVLCLAGAMFLSTTAGSAGSAGAAAGSVPAFVTVRAVVTQHCQPCHSQYQSDRTFGPAPGGITFDTPESIARLAERIRVRAVETRTMPPVNKTGMTDADRDILARWIAGGAPLR